MTKVHHPKRLGLPAHNRALCSTISAILVKCLTSGLQIEQSGDAKSERSAASISVTLNWGDITRVEYNDEAGARPECILVCPSYAAKAELYPFKTAPKGWRASEAKTRDAELVAALDEGPVGSVVLSFPGRDKLQRFIAEIKGPLGGRLQPRRGQPSESGSPAPTPPAPTLLADTASASKLEAATAALLSREVLTDAVEDIATILGVVLGDLPMASQLLAATRLLASAVTVHDAHAEVQGKITAVQSWHLVQCQNIAEHSVQDSTAGAQLVASVGGQLTELADFVSKAKPTDSWLGRFSSALTVAGFADECDKQMASINTLLAPLHAKQVKRSLASDLAGLSLTG